MANEQNLKHFKKGKSGNPKGRPKGHISLTTTFKKLLDKTYVIKNHRTGRDEHKSARQWLALGLMAKGIDGDVKALKMIFDRIDGKVPDKIDADVKIDFSQLSDEALQKFLNE